MENNVFKKKVVYVLFFLFTFNSLAAKVNPQPGENLWRLTARIGDCVDVADTKLDLLASQNDLICSKIDELEFADNCEKLIFQSDIPFTINEPGVYCLAESVNFSTGTAITIAAGNVLLDLNEKKIDGSIGGNVGIAINSGLNNITIQNGMLCNMNNKGIDADATNNIAFTSMSVSDSLIDSIVDMPLAIVPISCLQIKNISVLNVGQLKVFPIVSVVDSLIDSVIDTPDCVLSPITGIHLNCVNEVVLANCKTLNCLGDGFALQTVENGILKSCQAIKNGGNGFVLDSTDTSRFKWCQATMNCFNGFCDTGCASDNTYLGCEAKQNGIDGFRIAGGGKVMQECIAAQNVRNGFSLATSVISDGSLDVAFNPTGSLPGTVTTNLGGNDVGEAVALQKNGKIIVAGESSNNFALARYNSDGSLDVTFNQTGNLPGTVITDLGETDEIHAVAIQEDGKIVAAGESADNFALARYNSDGSLDISFNPTGTLPGTVITDLGGQDRVNGIAIQKDGKIVVAGSSDAQIAANSFAVARYNRDGSLDSTFNPTGSLPGTKRTLIGESSLAFGLLIQKNGKIVLAGRANVETPVANFNLAVARYNADGSLDVTFNPTGVKPGTVTTDFGGFDEGRAIAIQKNGKIVVAGNTNVDGTNDFAVARYNANGSLDNSFGSDGKVITNFGGSDIGRAVTIQKNGKIVVAGHSDIGGVFNNFAFVRYRIDGSLDATLNPTGSIPGTVITDMGGNEFGRAVTIQKGGKIVVVGNSSSDFAVAQYVVLKQGVAIKGCVAEENGQDGFNIAGSTYVVCDSISVHNAFNGFLLESLTDGCQLLSNKALQNGNIGLENLGTDNQILNNRSHNNTTSNYAGVALVATPTSTTGFWENVEA